VTVVQTGTTDEIACSGTMSGDLFTGSSCTFTGTAGTSYDISVLAKNTAGFSSAGTATATVAAVAPATPTVSASASGTAITVTWIPPTGAPVDGYEVTVKPFATTTTIPCVGSPASTSTPAGLLAGTSCTATGVPGTSYDIAVRAYNSAGYSSPGVAIVSVAPVGPDAPAVTASSSGTTITVSWTPNDTGGAVIDGYEVTILKSGTTSPPVACVGTNSGLLITGTTCTATGEPGASYNVAVRGHNSAGFSTAGTATVTINAVAPAAPTVTASTDGTTITVNWTPNDTGGAELNGYEVTITQAGAATPTTVPCAPTVSTASQPTSCTATGLRGATYSVAVKVQNSAGMSGAGTASVTIAPAAPAGPTVTAATSGSTITVSWTPGDNGGATLLGYRVTIARASGPGPDTLTCVGTTTSISSPALYTGTSCSVDGVPGAAYTVQVTAVNSAGDSPAGQASATITAVPAPTGITVTPGNATATVAWTPVGDYEGVTGYTVSYLKEGETTAQTAAVSAASATGTTLSGLENAKTYSVTVAADIATGLVTTSDAILVTPTAPIEVPAAVPTNPDGGLNAPAAGTTPEPGEQIVISGSGYAPNSLVKVVIYSNPIDLGEVLTDANGNFSLAVSVPSSLLGSHTITSIGFDSDGNPHVLTLPVTVTAAVASASSAWSGAGLAITGVPILAILQLGVVLVVVGATSRYAGGRHRRGRSK